MYILLILNTSILFVTYFTITGFDFNYNEKQALVLNYYKNKIDMVKGELIFITLAISRIVVNGITECQYQLGVLGGFNMNGDKTEAFIYALQSLSVPNDDLYQKFIKGILYDYQKELWKKFIAAHANHLKFMFDTPLEWYSLQTKKYCKCKNKLFLWPDETFLKLSREEVLEGMFLRLKQVNAYNLVSNMQLDYMQYIATSIHDYIKFTYARSPSDYCNKVESSPEKILVINEDGALEEVKNPDFNQSSHSVHQHEHFPIDLNYPLVSSSGAGGSMIDLDLNQLPPDEEK